MKDMNVKIEPIIAMYIIAMGEWNGTQWELFPKLPSCFAEELNFQASCGCNADFIRLTVNDLFKVEVWFADEDGDAFYYGLEDIMRSHPLLFTAIVTHVFDMIENLEE